MADHNEPKILNLGDLLREDERQREEVRQAKPADKPWIPWPETFNAGTCDENGAWCALKDAQDFLDDNYALSASFGRPFVPGYRHAEGGYEFHLPETFDEKPAQVLRVWLGEKGVDRVEVRRMAAASAEQAEVVIYAGKLQDKLARIRAHLQGVDVNRSFPAVYRGNDGYVTLGVVEACALIAAAREAMEP